MKLFRSRSAAAIAFAAALSLTASPVMARGYGGWGGGWGHRHHDRGIDGGDVLAGLLVIGGIAAIATAASNKNKQNREADYRYPDNRSPDRDDRAGDGGYQTPPSGYGNDRNERDYGASDRNLDGAVDNCVAEVERGNTRVDSIENVGRDGDGWRVEGRADNRDFSCAVDRDGRIRGVTVDGRAR